MAARVRRNACPDLDIVASTRKQLESEVAKHVDAIIDLKGRINAMAPISKLPPELLSAIFTEVATHHSTDRPPRSCCGTATLPYRWITLTHVCRTWRIIALDTPRLWSRIFLTRPDVTREVLARSKKAPLWVTANLSYVDELRRVLLDMIMKESSRLKELSVAGPTRILENLYPRWTGQATLLESLSLSDDSVFDPVGLPLFVERPSFPVVFQGSTPNLRHLNVHHVAIGWDNPLFCSTLTRLTVLSRYDSTTRLGNFGQFLQALDNMTLLESLELDEAIPLVDEDSASTFTPLRRVTLPNLRQLSLSSDAVNCAHFLSFVTFPPTARLLVTGRAELAVEELVRLFTAHLSHAPPLLTAHIAPTRSAQVLVRGWRELFPYELAPDLRAAPTPPPDAELILDAFPRARVVQHLKGCASALARVRCLQIQPPFGAWDWHGLFDHTPELRVLSVSGHPESRRLLDALSEVRTEPREDGEQEQDTGEGGGEESGTARRMLLPELHTLRMTGVRFGCVDLEDDPAYLEELVDWLIARCNEGAPLATLELRECTNAGFDGVERLRELVADVVWDGLETWDEDEDEDELQDEQDIMLNEMYADAGDLWPLFPEWDMDYGYEDDDEVDFQWIPF